MTQEDFQELLPAYALGALSTAEATQVEAYLSAHPEQKTELYKWQETVAACAWAAITTETPQETSAPGWEKLRQRLAALPPPSTMVAARSATSNVAIFPTPARMQAASASMPALSQPAAGFPWATLLTALAAVFLLLSLAVVLRNNRQLRSENRTLRQKMQALQTEQTSERAWQQNLLGPDGRGIVLQGTAAAPGACAHLAYNTRDGQAFFSARALPPAPPGKSYQLWFIAQGHVLAGDTFNTDGQGEARVRLQVPADGLRAESFAVTLETQTGTNQPSGEKYLSNGVS